MLGLLLATGFFRMVCSQVTTYQEAIKTLENLGEVNVKLACHSMAKDNGILVIRPDKAVCFSLDPLKEKKRKATLIRHQSLTSVFV